MDVLQKLLTEKGVALLDGGFATCLEENHGVSMHRKLWSAHAILTHPDVVVQAHCDYLAAGADIIETSSYQASFETFHDALGSTEAQVEEYLRKSVALAVEAINKFQSRKPLLAASMGPYGAILPDGAEFHGRYVETKTIDELKAFHRRRVSILASCPGVDLLAFETVPSLVEAQAICQLLEEDNVLIPSWISFSCKSGELTCHDEAFSDAVRVVLSSTRCVAVGINCTAPKFVKSLVDIARSEMENLNIVKPLVVYPNKGERYDADLQRWVPAPSEGNLHDCVESWIGSVQIFGGCCRTKPEDIQRLAVTIKRN